LEVAEKGRKAKNFCLENRNPILIMILALALSLFLLFIYWKYGHMRVES
jgi:hypothetical protein